jgi:gliding motility-associated-like protein
LSCVNTATAQVDADSNVPSATVTASSTNSTITCQNTSVTLTVSVNPSATYSYTWLPSGGNSSSANVTSSGTYTAVVLNSTTGCSTTATYSVSSNVTTPTVTSVDAVIPCGSPSVALSASSTATNSSFGWTTSGSGSILSGSNTATPSVGSTGQYVVTVTDNDNGCSNTQTVNVTQNTISASFTANPTSGTAPLTVGFTNQSTTPATYSWNFGDPTSTDNTSSVTDPSHVFNTTGTYTVLLTVSNGSCVATASVTIDVFENSSIIVPNVFTPNGDKVNDTFKFKTVGIKELTCDIFNRWGQKVYSIKDVNDFWDGGDAPDGTYFFIMKATGFDNKDYSQQGYLTLFR